MSHTDRHEKDRSPAHGAGEQVSQPGGPVEGDGSDDAPDDGAPNDDVQGHVFTGALKANDRPHQS